MFATGTLFPGVVGVTLAASSQARKAAITSSARAVGP
jgi:hypothetical protein